MRILLIKHGLFSPHLIHRMSWMVSISRSVFSFERSLGIILLAAILVVYYANPRPVEFFRLKTFDFYQQFKPRDIPPALGKPVNIIDLDE